MEAAIPGNPLRGDDQQAWSALIEAIGRPSLLVVIKRRMSAGLRARLAPEDVLQEALLHAWRDRASCEWQGVWAFRRCFLGVIGHRIRDLAEEARTQKRGGDRRQLPLTLIGAAGASSAPPVYCGPVATTTPSRVASDAEAAAALEVALDSIDEDLREVVRLRIFEDRGFRGPRPDDCWCGRAAGARRVPARHGLVSRFRRYDVGPSVLRPGRGGRPAAGTRCRPPRR